MGGINICGYDAIEDYLREAFRNNRIVLILGAGFSGGEEAKNGIVPFGKDFVDHMIDELKKNRKIPEEYFKELQHEKFQEISELYEDDEYVAKAVRRKYYSDCFTEVRLSDDKKKILEITWPYIYTLNIDDAIEKNSLYNHVIYANRPVEEEILNEKKCVIKLHGDISDMLTYGDSSCRVFTSEEYIRSIMNNCSLLNKLKHDYQYLNILFIGCSFNNEFDLISLNFTSSNFQSHNIRRFVFLKEEPDFKTERNLKKYGITDVVIISDFEEIYNRIYYSWKESKKIMPTDLEKYRNIKIEYLNKGDKENIKYILYGHNLYDTKHNQLLLPCFFTSRKESIRPTSIPNCAITFIKGRSVSGKSYFLVDLYLKYQGKNKYYFNSFVKLNDKTLDLLLEEENAAFFFDVGVVTSNQFEKILSKSNQINDKSSQFIFVLSMNNSDFMGIVKQKLRTGQIVENNIGEMQIEKRFSPRETNEINGILPFLSLPAINSEKNILDNLITIHRDVVKRGTYSKLKIKVDHFTIKDLELYIYLATKERIDSYELIKFDLEKTLSNFSNRYRAVIDEDKTESFEISSKDNSPTKYLLNSKFWLHTELGNYALREENQDSIYEAYLSIIRSIKESSEGSSSWYRRESYRDFILFDIINNIFSLKKKRNLKFIIGLYEKLNSELADDYQYLHQFSKGYLMYSYLLKQDETKKELHTETLEKALNKIQIAISIVEEEIRKKLSSSRNTDNNEITLAHMNFTKTIIDCECCIDENFLNIEAVEECIVGVDKVLQSPYNYLKMEQQEQENTLKKFINQCRCVNLSSESKKIMNRVSNQFFDMKRITY